MLAFITRTIRWIFRTLLLVISLCSGFLGAHGVYVHIFKSDIIVGVNADRIFLAWHIPNFSVSRIIEQVTIYSAESVILPIVLIAVGLVAWVTQSSMAQRPFYRRVRFSTPTQASPIAWLLIVAGVLATVYVIANWQSIDKGVAVLVIVANTISIIWNLSIFRR